MAGYNNKCGLCPESLDQTELKKLKCSHQFCLKCLNQYLKDHLNCKIKCPEESCCAFVRDAIIREILDENDIEKYETLSLNNMANNHHCILPECGSVIIYDSRNIQYECPNCTLFNCIICDAAHIGMNCDTYHSTAATTGKIACQEEIARAKEIFDKKLAESRRKSIIDKCKAKSVPNPEIFLCVICQILIRKGVGVLLKNCHHQICRDCLRNHINTTKEIPFSCPYECCGIKLDDAETREVLSEEEEMKYDEKMVQMADRKKKGLFHCQGPDCKNIIFVEDKTMKEWSCDICHSVNCLQCLALHTGISCEEFIKTSDKHIEGLIKRKVIMRCPVCSNLIRKTIMCNWILCNRCNTELCWILQTYRWGPGGHGDESGGCRCGVNGKMCHPDCDGCIFEEERIISGRRDLEARTTTNNIRNNDTRQNPAERTTTNNTSNNDGSCVII